MFPFRFFPGELQGSLLNNDKNTLVNKGDTPVADLYFTGFACIFYHFSTRGDIKKLTSRNESHGHNLSHLWPRPEDWVPSFYHPNGLKD